MSVINSCDTLSGISVSPEGQISIDNVDFVEGTGSLRATSIGGTTSFITTIRIPVAQENFSNIKSLDLKIKSAPFDSLALWLDAPNSSNRFYVNLLNYITTPHEWLLNVSIPVSAFGTYAGNPSWNRITNMVIRAWTYGAVAEFKLDDVRRTDFTGNLQVTVIEETTPVKGATVEVVEARLAGTTNELGMIEFTDLIGVYTVRVSHPVPYWATQEKTVTVYKYETATLTFVFKQIVKHQLTVTADSLNIDFKVKSVGGETEMSYQTPWSGKLEQGNYDIEFPERVQINGVTHEFVRWEDYSTNRIRTIALTIATIISTVYRAIVTPVHNLSISSSLDAVPVTIRNVYTLVSINVLTPWSEDLDEGTYDIIVPERIDDPALPEGSYWKFKQWEDYSTNRSRRIGLTLGTNISFEHELVSEPSDRNGGLSLPVAVALSAGAGAVGYAVAEVPGAVVLGSVTLAGTYIIPKALPPSTQCVQCNRELTFTTYNTPVWCKYCGKEQVVKQVIRRG